jgi:hypothetical protein
VTALVQAVLIVLQNAHRHRGGTFARDCSRAEADAFAEARLQGWMASDNTLTDAGRAALHRLERDLG